MIDESLINYINQARGADLTDEKIRQELLRSGWQQDDITAALQQTPVLSSAMIKVQNKIALPGKILFWLLGLVVIAGVTFGVYWVINNTGNQSVVIPAENSNVDSNVQDQQLCERTGGNYLFGTDCPACPDDTLCKQCFVGCTCPSGSEYISGFGCKRADLIDTKLGSDAEIERCMTLVSAVDQTICLVRAAQRDADLTICDAAESDGVTYQCYAIYAEHIQQKDPCLQIPTTTQDMRRMRDKCLSDVAKKTGDSTICIDIKAQNFIDSCYLKTAIINQDPTLCDIIEDEGLQTQCFADTTIENQ